MKRFICCISLLFICLSIHAQMEFPPPVESRDEIEEYARKIRLTIPEIMDRRYWAMEVNVGLPMLIRNEQKLIQTLKIDANPCSRP